MEARPFQNLKTRSRDSFGTPFDLILHFFDNVSVLKLSVKFNSRLISSPVTDTILLVFNTSLIWRKMHIPAYFGEVFGAFDPLNVVQYCGDPQKAHPRPETCVLVYRSKIVPIGQEMRPEQVLRKQKRKKERKETQRCDKSHICPDQQRCATPTKSCDMGFGRSQPCQVLSNAVQGFRLPDELKSAIFLCLALWLI